MALKALDSEPPFGVVSIRVPGRDESNVLIRGGLGDWPKGLGCFQQPESSSATILAIIKETEDPSRNRQIGV
jgi:hypothetical protein